MVFIDITITPIILWSIIDPGPSALSRSYGGLFCASPSYVRNRGCWIIFIFIFILSVDIVLYLMPTLTVSPLCQRWVLRLFGCCRCDLRNWSGNEGELDESKQKLYIIRAHLYTTLEDFRKSIQSIRDPPNPAMNVDPNRQRRKPRRIFSMRHLLSEVGEDVGMQNKRVKNVMNLVGALGWYGHLLADDVERRCLPRSTLWIKHA